MMQKIRRQAKQVIFATGQTPDTIFLTVDAAIDLLDELHRTHYPPTSEFLTLPDELLGMRPVILKDVMVGITGGESQDVGQ